MYYFRNKNASAQNIKRKKKKHDTQSCTKRQKQKNGRLIEFIVILVHRILRFAF